jgi:hypothetical protein
VSNNSQCTYVDFHTKEQCKNRAVNGGMECVNHGGTAAEYPGGVPAQIVKDVASRRMRASALLGPKFGEIVEDTEGAKDFSVDDALFQYRQEELMKRVQELDSPDFRKEMVDDAESLLVLYQRSHATTNPKLLQAFEELAQKARRGVAYDSTWERLLADTERRVKVITTVMQTLQREQSLLTVADLTKKFDQMIGIVYSEVGDEPTERIVARIEREIFGIYRGVAVSTEIEATLALGSGE